MNAVVEREQTAVAVPEQTPMAMLALAVQQGADIDKLTKLMDLQERWEKNEARKAFLEAVAQFKKNPPAVLKDRMNKQYGSWYTSIGNLVNTVNEHLAPHGLSTRWDIKQDEKINVTCYLVHRMGHSESASMSGSPDTSGQKNPLQQIKSTVTYLKIATFEAVTGIASVDGNADDDGNGAGQRQGPEPDAAGKAKLEACASHDALQKAWAGLTPAQRKTLAAVKDECKARITKADA